MSKQQRLSQLIKPAELAAQAKLVYELLQMNDRIAQSFRNILNWEDLSSYKSPISTKKFQQTFLETRLFARQFCQKINYQNPQKIIEQILRINIQEDEKRKWKINSRGQQRESCFLKDAYSSISSIQANIQVSQIDIKLQQNHEGDSNYLPIIKKQHKIRKNSMKNGKYVKKQRKNEVKKQHCQCQ